MIGITLSVRTPLHGPLAFGLTLACIQGSRGQRKPVAENSRRRERPDRAVGQFDPANGPGSRSSAKSFSNGEVPPAISDPINSAAI